MPAPRKSKAAPAGAASAEPDEKPVKKAAKASKAPANKVPAKEVPAAQPSAVRDSAAPDKTPVRAKKTAAVKEAPVENTAPAGDAAESTDEPVPMNRAMRRAKSKGGQPAPTYGPTRVTGSKGPAHTHRMWSNRRSGG